MPTEKLSEHDFDMMLGRALRSSSEPVPADFAGRMLKQIRQSREREVLARIVLQERLALTGCIVLLAVAVLAPMMLSDSVAGVLQGKAAGFAQECRVLLDKLPTAVEAVWGRPRLYAILGATIAFAAYCLVALFFGDRNRPLPILDS